MGKCHNATKMNTLLHNDALLVADGREISGCAAPVACDVSFPASLLNLIQLLSTEDEEEQETALTHGTLETNLSYAAAAASGRRCCRIVTSMAKFLLMAQRGEGFENLTQIGKGGGGGLHIYSTHCILHLNSQLTSNLK